jgi:GcrA cell cycle regulator
MSWTEEQVSTLKRLWLEGLSASQIAKQLTGVSRNAVIGKVHRLGLSGRAAASQPSLRAASAPRPPRPVVQRVPSPPRRAAPAETLPVQVPAKAPALRCAPRQEAPGAATVLTVGAHMCKWPIGDPLADGFTLCGRRALDGASYCVDHASLAYQPKRPPRARPGHGIAKPRGGWLPQLRTYS